MNLSRSTRDFRIGLGHPVLDLLATLAGRQRQPLERLSTPDDLGRWLALTGLAPTAACSTEQLVWAHDLREATFRVLQAARDAGRPDARDLELLNDWARRSRPVPQLSPALRVHRDAPDPCAAALAELAASAVELIGGPELARIRNCADPTCSLMFIDRSRPGRRRWCSMDRCGNRAKTARYRRHRGAGGPRSRA